MVEECCATCRNKMKLTKLDYSQGGCKHTDMEGFACLCFVDEKVVEWHVGNDPNIGMCECYEPIPKT